MSDASHGHRVLTNEVFDFVLANELKRALRSQNFVTLVVMGPRGGEPDRTVGEIAGLVSRELRETDILSADATTLSIVLLEADVSSAARVIERVMARLEHYHFSTPVEIDIGAACCPTDGVDLATLKQAAGRTELRRRAPASPARDAHHREQR